MGNEKEKSFKELLQEEVESRIEEIESPEYEYVPRLTKADYVGMVTICVVILVIGII